MCSLQVSYGQERGITFYNLVSDRFTGLNGIAVPGTLRDSLVLLSSTMVFGGRRWCTVSTH